MLQEQCKYINLHFQGWQIQWNNLFSLIIFIRFFHCHGPPSYRLLTVSLHIWEGQDSVIYGIYIMMQAAIESLQSKLTCNILNFKSFPTQENATKQLYGRLDLKPNPQSTKNLRAPSKSITCSMLMIAPFYSKPSMK